MSNTWAHQRKVSKQKHQGNDKKSPLNTLQCCFKISKYQENMDAAFLFKNKTLEPPRSPRMRRCRLLRLW